MKNTILMTLLLLPFLSNAQSEKNKKNITLSAYERGMISRQEVLNADFARIIQEKKKQDSLFAIFFVDFVRANQIDPKRLGSGDSTKITSQGVTLILKDQPKGK